jgi:hypothetical protein
MIYSFKTIAAAATIAAMTGCASYPVPAQHMADAEGAARSARDVGAGSDPQATIHLTANVSDIQPLPRNLEIQLALSALPPQLRDNATVYVLNPDKGFEVAREGTNGFHAFVARTGDDAMQGAWSLTKYPADILYPISFDSAGAKANMQGFFDIAEMQAKGTQPETLKRLIQERYKTGYYKGARTSGMLVHAVSDPQNLREIGCQR